MKIGIIGTGTIATALVTGIAEAGHQITVSQRSVENSAALAARFDSVTVADNQGVVDASDVIFLGLMADVMADIVTPLSFRAGQRVISLSGMVALADLADWVAPATGDALMIPFPGIARGGSPVLALGNPDMIEAIFGQDNMVITMTDRAELAAYQCAQAVLSPAITLVAEAAGWLGARVQDPDQGEAFLRMLVGTSLMASDCAGMLAALDTPGGFNQRLREHMTKAGMVSDLTAGLDTLED